MSLQNFMEGMLREIKKRLGKGFQAQGDEILKNNGVAAHAITIRRQDEAVAPCIYIDDLYERHLSGVVDMNGAADEAVRRYRENAEAPGVDVSALTDFKRAIAKVHGRLINTEMNRRILENAPHREFLDLSLVYEVRLSSQGQMAGGVLIHNRHLEGWGVNEGDLYEAARRNLKNASEAFFEKMDTVLSGWMKPGADMESVPMYILSNKEWLNGAVQMLNEDILKLAAEAMEDDFAILPSSVHEVILAPAARKGGEADCAQELAEIVREVNDTQVAKTEILSYHVYRYRRETGKVTIAA